MKKYRSIESQKGFTLIEIIAVLALVGLLASMAGLSVVTGVRGYLMAAENAMLAQKAQMAMVRLNKELKECFDCGGSPGAIALPYIFENHLGTRTLSISGNSLLLNNSILTDRVSLVDFNRVSVEDQRITIDLVMIHQQAATTRTFTSSVLPRNL